MARGPSAADAGIGDAGGVAFRGARRAFVTDVAKFVHGSGIRKALFNILEEDLLFDKIFSLISLLAKLCFQFRGQTGPVAVPERLLNIAKGRKGWAGSPSYREVLR